MRIIGIDPGVTRCGYGVLDAGRDTQLITGGVLTTLKTEPVQLRLMQLSDDLIDLMTEFKPDVVVLERVFFQTNLRTAMSVSQASGLVLVEAQRAGAQIVQYTSNEVKLSIAGDGAATKAEMQDMVQKILKLPNRPSPPDAADALGLALCHATQVGYHNALAKCT